MHDELLTEALAGLLHLGMPDDTEPEFTYWIMQGLASDLANAIPAVEQLMIFLMYGKERLDLCLNDVSWNRML